MLERFERGEITPDQWRAFRLVRGTYGQRQADDAQMLRVKIPQGILTRSQLDALADVAERYSRGFGHITTRQNVQFHFVKLHDVEPAMRRLADAGLTTREACGNSVRNITACPYAGVAADEPFDVTPYAEALTRYLLRHPLSSTLPRKFKIAFEGCPHDHIGTRDQRHRLARASRQPDGRGAASASPSPAARRSWSRAGHVLYEFLPGGRDAQRRRSGPPRLPPARRLQAQAAQPHEVPDQVARLGRLPAEFERELEAFRADAAARRCRSIPSSRRPRRRRFRRGRTRAVRRRDRRARGVHARDRARASCPRWSRASNASTQRLRATGARPTCGRRSSRASRWRSWRRSSGDLTRAQMRVLGELAPAYGDGTVRVTVDQNLVFRWVRSRDVEALYRRLAAAGLSRGGAGTLADVTSCPGAESCRLAVTQSRGLGRLLEDHLARAARSRRGGPRPRHQDQRLPERLRPASHRGHRLPGQRAQGRRPRRRRSTS